MPNGMFQSQFYFGTLEHILLDFIHRLFHIVSLKRVSHLSIPGSVVLCSTVERLKFGAKRSRSCAEIGSRKPFGYPLVNVYKRYGKSPFFLMGKLTVL